MKAKWKRRNISEKGLIVYNIRKSHKMTQKQFADLLGTTQSTISNWETGRTYRISPYWWKTICENFGADVERCL